MQFPRCPQPSRIRRLLALAALISLPGLLLAQRSRIAGTIVDSQRFTLSGHIHPNATSQFDQGKADPALELNSVTLVLKPSDTQQADLNSLLAQQQDPSSKNYHVWLTPEQFADRFGASQADIDKIVAWVKSQQLTVTSVARGRNAVILKGTAAQAGSAFGTEIHMYLVNGETHYANATEPSLPAALQGVVQAIHGLHNFRMKARTHKLTPLGLAADGISPAYTSTGSHSLAPDDFATIYDISPLYKAGIDGTGQKMVIVGQTTIVTSHLTSFRSYFGLSTPNLTTLLVPTSTNPGSSASDAEESDLDLQWASAVARNASLLFVYAYDVTEAVQYAIDQNLAPVISMSYGECEVAGRNGTLSDATTMQSWAQQGNAQGITWVASSGDSGAADCYESSTGSFGSSNSSLALAVDLPGSIPEVTSVGGTEFTEGSGSYWNTTNTTTKESAKSYIPETTWNDTATDGSPSASGGGASIFFSKPSWQTGTGVPNDNARDVPDVALSASADHDGYMVYTTSGRTTGWYIFGGTSCAAPTFSGILTLLDQYLVSNGYQSNSGLGNVNSHLYSYATSTPNAFHDVTTGDNIVSASSCSGPRCTPVTTTSGGYSAGVGYDQATGLGSVDAFNFVSAWHTGALLLTSTPAVTVTAGPAILSTAGSTTLTATVTSTNGFTPTGTVTFSVGSVILGTATLYGSSGTATAVLTISGGAAGLITGSDTITASYGGDSSFNPATAATSLTVVSPSSVAPSIAGATNAASYNQSYAPGMLLSIFGTNLALSTRTTTGSLPLPTVADNVSVTVNGVAAPFYYISPSQLNVQIPYATPTSGKVTLTVSNNGQTASTTLQMAAAAPGIFTDSNGAPVPTATAARGQNVTVYVSGAGAVTPSAATGAVPVTGTTPIPVGATVVTVGGVQASASYVGIPSWSVGVLQINFTVPSTAPLGSQSLVVTVGGVASPAVPLTVRSE